MKTILCYGDSNTWGWIPGEEGRHSWHVRWTGVLQRSLGDEYRVIEEGLGGRTTCFEDPFSPGRNGLSYLPISLESHSPLDLLVIMLGTNDVKIRYNLTPFTIARGAAELVIYAKKFKPTILNILLISPPHVAITNNTENTLTFEGGIKKSQELALHYHYFAEQQSCNFFNAASVVKSSEVDGIHLDENAHQLLGDAVYKEVIKIFGSGV